MGRLQKKTLQSLSKLKKRAWDVFSKWIRSRDKNICCSCGKKCDGDAQAGHYISRRHMATFFDEKNVNCQCYRCNILLKGNYPQYTLYLIQKYGPDIVKELTDKSRNIVKLKKYDMIDIMQRYDTINQKSALERNT